MILIALAVLAANPQTVVGATAAASKNGATASPATTGPVIATQQGNVLAANPATLASAFTAAKPGDTIRLVAGRYPQITFRNRTFNPPLTIDASAATMTGVFLRGVSGVHWSGGTIDGSVLAVPSSTDFGLAAYSGSNIVVTGVHFTTLLAGVVYDHIAGGEISGNWFAKMRSDGIDLAVSRSVTVANNACTDFQVANGAHPDCIQAWSKPTDPPVADITVTGNSAVGTMQGISFFDGAVDGVQMGGFDRVTITGNTVLNTYGDGISAYNCRGCTVRNNTVNSLPNYLNLAQLVIIGGSVNQCGNVVVRVPRQGTPPCPN